MLCWSPPYITKNHPPEHTCPPLLDPPPPPRPSRLSQSSLPHTAGSRWLADVTSANIHVSALLSQSAHPLLPHLCPCSALCICVLHGVFLKSDLRSSGLHTVKWTIFRHSFPRGLTNTYSPETSRPTTVQDTADTSESTACSVSDTHQGLPCQASG